MGLSHSSRASILPRQAHDVSPFAADVDGVAGLGMVAVFGGLADTGRPMEGSRGALTMDATEDADGMAGCHLFVQMGGLMMFDVVVAGMIGYNAGRLAGFE